MRFLYVMTEADRDALLSAGYTMLKAKGNVFVFEADPDDAKFTSLGDIRYVLSNVLTF